MALEAVFRALLEASRGAVDAARARLDGESVVFEPPQDSMRQITRFIETLSLETLDTAETESRLVRLVHAIDHLKQLHEDLRQAPTQATSTSHINAAGAAALSAWLEAQKTTNDNTPGILEAIAAASQQLTAEKTSAREKILEAVALQRMSAPAADQALQSLEWADSATYHAWRLVNSLYVASNR